MRTFLHLEMKITHATPLNVFNPGCNLQNNAIYSCSGRVKHKKTLLLIEFQNVSVYFTVIVGICLEESPEDR